MAGRLCLLVVVATWSRWAAGQASPYCSFTPQHTMCKHSGVAPRCGSKVQTRGVGAQDAAAIVLQHNQARSRVAMGQERRGTPGPQPKAGNMMLMEWDAELAVVAQRHADQCVFDHECADCRRVSRFGVGQNLFISFQSNFDARVQWSRAIKSWYDEVADFSPADIEPFQFAKGVGHYTQMLWWKTDRVGCGFTMFQEGGWWKKLYTCNYGPAGNIIFSQMYNRGTPCSSCPDGTSCSRKFPGLCDNSSVSSKVAPRRPTTATTTTTMPPNISDHNNNRVNTISISPGNTNNGFNGLTNVNNINPNNVDLNSLIAFFNNRWRTTTTTHRTSLSNSNQGGQVRPIIMVRPTIASTTLPSSIKTPPVSKATAIPTTASTTTTKTTSSTKTPSGASSAITTPSPQGAASAPSFTNKILTQRTRPSGTQSFFAANTNQDAKQLVTGSVHQDSQEQDNMFIPFSGNQPVTSDLMPFLRRAGMDPQIIRTSSLSSVQSIINALPKGLKPIVLYRSGSGQLTELDAGTLAPIKRHGRSTTTRGHQRGPQPLLACDLDFAPCEVTPIGGNWTVANSESEGRYAVALLGEGEGAQVVVEELVTAPSTEAVCVALSHRRDLSPDAPSDANIPQLQVGVMTAGGEMTRRTIPGAPGIWEMSRVTLSNVKSPFLVVMTLGPATEGATVALDAMMVTDGGCCLSGEC
ncbi:uncharacterized protein [Procambarus clarkii]|uniref:uncharacterized protein isoform X1 n=1 Tax=Procambarus clarkii TaxID=6728 RepID=UPI0037441737